MYLQITLWLPPENSPFSPRRWKSLTTISSFWHWRAMCTPLPSGSILTTELSGCLLRRRIYGEETTSNSNLHLISCTYIPGRLDLLLNGMPWAFSSWSLVGPSQHRSIQTDLPLFRKECLHCLWGDLPCLSAYQTWDCLEASRSTYSHFHPKNMPWLHWARQTCLRMSREVPGIEVVCGARLLDTSVGFIWGTGGV